MSQRNPMNERYTTSKPAGKTRKSAASAKPVSKAAASVQSANQKPAKKGLFGGGSSSSTKSTTASKPKKSSTAQALPKEQQEAIKKDIKANAKLSRKEERARNREINRFVPDTPEFNALNRKRMIYSGVGLAGMVVAIVLSLVVPTLPWLSIGLMLVAWLFFFWGMRIDTRQMRPLRVRGYEKAQRDAERKAKRGKKK